jgi:hypothetical protein
MHLSVLFFFIPSRNVIRALFAHQPRQKLCIFRLQLLAPLVYILLYLKLDFVVFGHLLGDEAGGVLAIHG